MDGPVPTITQAAYQQAHAWGLSTCIDIFDCDPGIVRNRELIEMFTRDLCDRLGVQRFGDRLIVRFGEGPAVYGHSLVQLFETSLVSAPFVEGSSAVYLDIFSCRWYDADVAVEFARARFKGGRVHVQQ